ncbi:Reverse transcriptase/retrotransposon-derived protein, RNase H-like domain [Dillenia turbinata]|uniref:Reverse transcriptase/retrotransposon-derived protein, RNase H-like domain n=1 Tax=Dillenia turbinata TaxID=194707 RepID=A0AAN8VVB5_9MAGN
MPRFANRRRRPWEFKGNDKGNDKDNGKGKGKAKAKARAMAMAMATATATTMAMAESKAQAQDKHKHNVTPMTCGLCWNPIQHDPWLDKAKGEHVEDVERLFPQQLGYSRKATLLIDLLKKDGPWAWTNQCQEAFKALKETVAYELMLRLPNFTLPFKVHTDASDKAVGGVLEQDRHPIAFESWKLKEAKQRYLEHEKEMIAMHSPGKQNQVVNVLSWKDMDHLVAAWTMVEADLLPRLRVDYLVAWEDRPLQAIWEKVMALWQFEKQVQSQNESWLGIAKWVDWARRYLAQAVSGETLEGD